MSYSPRFKNQYSEEIVPALKEKFQYTSVMQVPRLKKIVVSQGLGDATADKKIIENSLQELAMITGQKPIATIAKKDVSNFKLRKGMPIGAKVTLRGDIMYAFLDRLVAVALSRTEAFRGINTR